MNDGKEVFEALPQSFHRYDKYVIGIFSENILIGMIDCLVGYPTKDKAHIGLLLLNENYQSLIKILLRESLDDDSAA